MNAKVAYWNVTDWAYWLLSHIWLKPKTIRLPGREHMLRRLQRVSSEQGLIDGFYPRLLQNAGKRRMPKGVEMMLALAIRDYAGSLPEVRDVLWFRIDEFVCALIINAKARREALAAVSAVKTQMRDDAAERAASLPARPGAADRARLFPFVLRLAELADEHNDERGRQSSEGHRSAGPNPYFHQTTTGAFLEMYYGCPSKVWTPWGELHFADMRFGADVDGFMARLTLVEFMPETDRMGAPYGPVYGIVAIDGEALPDAALADQAEFLSAEDSHAEWEALCQGRTAQPD